MRTTVTSAPTAGAPTPRPLFDPQGYEPAFDVTGRPLFPMMPLVAIQAAGGTIQVIVNSLEELRQ